MGSRDEDDAGSRSADEAALSARLRRLGERLAQAETHAKPQAQPPAPADRSGFARGFRLSTEFVAGVIFGAILGWGIDRWLHTAPWGLIVCLLLGFAAGVLNVVRTAGITTAGGGTERPND